MKIALIIFILFALAKIASGAPRKQKTSLAYYGHHVVRASDFQPQYQSVPVGERISPVGGHRGKRHHAKNGFKVPKRRKSKARRSKLNKHHAHGNKLIKSTKAKKMVKRNAFKDKFDKKIKHGKHAWESEQRYNGGRKRHHPVHKHVRRIRKSHNYEHEDFSGTTMYPLYMQITTEKAVAKEYTHIKAGAQGIVNVPETTQKQISFLEMATLASNIVMVPRTPSYLQVLNESLASHVNTAPLLDSYLQVLNESLVSHVNTAPLLDSSNAQHTHKQMFATKAVVDCAVSKVPTTAQKMETVVEVATEATKIPITTQVLNESLGSSERSVQPVEIVGIASSVPTTTQQLVGVIKGTTVSMLPLTTSSAQVFNHSLKQSVATEQPLDSVIVEHIDKKAVLTKVDVDGALSDVPITTQQTFTVLEVPTVASNIPMVPRSFNFVDSSNESLQLAANTEQPVNSTVTAYTNKYTFVPTVAVGSALTTEKLVPVVEETTKVTNIPIMPLTPSYIHLSNESLALSENSEHAVDSVLLEDMEKKTIVTQAGVDADVPLTTEKLVTIAEMATEAFNTPIVSHTPSYIQALNESLLSNDISTQSLITQVGVDDIVIDAPTTTQKLVTVAEVATVSSNIPIMSHTLSDVHIFNESPQWSLSTEQPVDNVIAEHAEQKTLLTNVGADDLVSDVPTTGTTNMPMVQSTINYVNGWNGSEELDITIIEHTDQNSTPLTDDVDAGLINVPSTTQKLFNVVEVVTEVTNIPIVPITPGYEQVFNESWMSSSEQPKDSVDPEYNDKETVVTKADVDGVVIDVPITTENLVIVAEVATEATNIPMMLRTSSYVDNVPMTTENLVTVFEVSTEASFFTMMSNATSAMQVIHNSVASSDDIVVENATSYAILFQEVLTSTEELISIGATPINNQFEEVSSISENFVVEPSMLVTSPKSNDSLLVQTSVYEPIEPFYFTEGSVDALYLPNYEIVPDALPLLANTDETIDSEIESTTKSNVLVDSKKLVFDVITNMYNFLFHML